MIFEQAHWAAAVFLVAALVLILRLRKQISEIDRRSYALIVAGVGLLLGASVLQIGRDFVFTRTASAIAPVLFVQLVWGIIGITGLSLILIGVSNWMPLVKRHHQFNDIRFGRLNLLRHLEQLLAVEHRLDPILSNTMENIISQYGFSAGSVYKISTRGRKAQLAAAKGVSFEEETDLLALSFDEDRWLQSHARTSPLTVAGFDGFPHSLGLPWKSLPVLVDDRLVAVFLFWIAKEATFTADDAQMFSIIGDVIGRKIAADRDGFAHVGAVSRLSRRNRLDGCYDSRRDLKENLKALTEWLREQLPIEIVSLTLIRDDQSAARATLTAAGASLVEARVDVGRTSLIRQALSIDAPTVVTDLSRKMTLAVEPALGGKSAKSLVAMPITVDGDRCAVLVLASAQTDRYSRADVETLATAQPVLITLVRDWRRAERENKLVNGFSKLVAAADAAIVDGDGAQVYTDMAEALHELLGRADVRILSLEDNQDKAKSRALAIAGDTRLALGADAVLDLATLPVHQERIRQITSTSGQHPLRIDDVEARQIYGREVRNARIEPVMVHGRPVALVTVGFHSSTTPAHTDALLSVASRLLTIVAVTSKTAATPRLSLSDKLLRARSGELRMRSKMKSSLTGILGSIEILKAQSEPEKADLGRYLSIIDRSARRLQTYLEGARDAE